MAELHTHGRWVVKDGREDEFIRLWQEFADWTVAEVEGARWAVLLQDQQNPRLFSSFGPWESSEAIDNWRGSDGFTERVRRIGEMLESFEALTMQQVGAAGWEG